MKNITVVGAGYVGLANSFLIGLSRPVTLIDIDQSKVEMLNNGLSPISDEYIQTYISQVDVTYTSDQLVAYSNADIVFIATDTNYDDELNKFNLTSVKSALEDVHRYAKEGVLIIIKSTVPIGFTDEMQTLYPQSKILFSPEFLREGYALYDNLHPDRIVVGGGSEHASLAKEVAKLLSENTIRPGIPVVLTSNREAEVVKLFANTYLAMRVSFVNELDTYCQASGLETANVLDAIGYDHRIGREYWNPSFGYGGYCLPKDTKQLNSEYVAHDIPQNLVSNIVKSNETRKQFICDTVIQKVDFDKSKVIGVYRVIAKKGINNFRSSAVIDVVELLIKAGYTVKIYEPYATGKINSVDVISDYTEFEQMCDIIIANRLDEVTRDNPKVYSVDIYNQY